MAAGYAFQTTTHIVRFYSLRLSWANRLFEAALIGGVLFLAARWVTLILNPIIAANSTLSAIYRDFNNIFPFPFTGSVVITIFLAFALSMGLNLVVPISRAWRIVGSGNYLVDILNSSMYDNRALIFYLDSNIVFIGYVIGTSGHINENKYITILLLAEGKILDGGSQFEIERDYKEHLSEMQSTTLNGNRNNVAMDSTGRSVSVVIPTDTIKIARFLESYPSEHDFIPDGTNHNAN